VLSPSRKFALGMARPHWATVMYPPHPSLFRRYRTHSSRVTQSFGSDGPWPQGKHRVGLYVHVPYCQTRCAFCDYAVVVADPSELERFAVYGRAVMAELEVWRRVLPHDVRLTGLDLGGGTATMLPPELLVAIVTKIRQLFGVGDDFEISFETTPELALARRDDLTMLRKAGVGRVSMGVQSLNRKVLEAGGRGRQRAEQVHHGMHVLRDVGFDVVNVDLMFAQRGQDLDTWAETLASVCELEPDVITTYDTVYKGRAIANQGDLPSQAAYADGYDMAWTTLRAAGFLAPYGSVNFSAVAGRRGTSRYLESRILEFEPYVGVGLYASSLMGNVWAFNARDIGRYLSLAGGGRLAAGDVYDLPLEHVAAKLVLGMLSYGFVDPDRYARRFGETLESRFGWELRWLVGRELMVEREGRYELAHGAFGSLPGIRGCFMPSETSTWLQLSES
jgi:oxygen-independent coproporphyrinogen-3 oxidase